MNQLYEKKVCARKRCSICYDKYPRFKERICHLPSEYDSSEINPWRIWKNGLNNLDRVIADIMIIGQDWGNLENFNKFEGNENPKDDTNKNLLELISKLNRPKETTFFFTNAMLCLKTGSKSQPIPQSIVNTCIKEYTKPLILDVVQPKVVITLGRIAFHAIAKIFTISLPSKWADFILNPDQSRNHWIELNPNTIWFPVFHCGRFGMANNKREKQNSVWERMGVEIKERFRT